MAIDELKALGAPWPAAEVQISDEKKITRLVFLVRDGDGFRAFDDSALDFPWHVNEDFNDADALARISHQEAVKDSFDGSVSRNSVDV